MHLNTVLALVNVLSKYMSLLISKTLLLNPSSEEVQFRIGWDWYSPYKDTDNAVSIQQELWAFKSMETLSSSIPASSRMRWIFLFAVFRTESLHSPRSSLATNSPKTFKSSVLFTLLTAAEAFFKITSSSVSLFRLNSVLFLLVITALGGWLWLQCTLLVLNCVSPLCRLESISRFSFWKE